MFTIYPKKLRDILIEKDELIDGISEIYYNIFIRKDFYDNYFAIGAIKAILHSVVSGFTPVGITFTEEELHDMMECYEPYAGNSIINEGWVDYPYLYLYYAEKVVREHLKLFLYALLMDGNLLISRESRPEKSDKVKIIISKRYGDEKEFYEMDIKSLVYTKIIDSKEELDNIQWGEILNVLKNIKNKEIKKEENLKKHKNVECAKKLEKAIHTYLDLDLRHNIAHGKIRFIREIKGEEENISMAYMKRGKEQKISLEDFFQKYNKMREFSFILTASLATGLGKYLLEIKAGQADSFNYKSK